MKKNIKDLLEIISEVRDRYQLSENNKSIRTLRNNAVNNISIRRNVDRATIANSYIRSLSPFINNTAHFDKLLEECLLRDSNELYNIIVTYGNNSYSKQIIDEAFAIKSEEDKHLAYEFGYDIINKSFIEGKEKLKLHITKERNHYLIRDAKRMWKDEYNDNIRCKVCNFSFFDFYGEIGKNFIEAHHNIPISELSEETIMKISNLVPVCSNCHKIIHLHKPMLKIDELKEILKKQNNW